MTRGQLLRSSSLLPLCALGLVSGCGQASPDAEPDSVASASQAVTTSVIKHVFVVAMENHDAAEVYGDTTDAPYINGTLVPSYAHSTNFNDDLALSIPSEPHYVWIEAGTNAFSDHTFTTDSDPSKSNSTSSTSHLATQIKNATNGVTWRTYQEGLDSATGTCPIHSSGFFAAKHDPFVFFKDVVGSPPSATNSYCTSHHRAYSSFAGDLSVGRRRELHVYHARPLPRHARSVGLSGLESHPAGRRLVEHRASADHHLRQGQRRRHFRRVGRGRQHAQDAVSGHRPRA